MKAKYPRQRWCEGCGKEIVSCDRFCSKCQKAIDKVK